MDIREASNLARQLMDQHGLSAWRLRFDSARRRFGVCKYRTQVISLSRPLVALNSDTQVRDTILHEIAHALAGPQAGHGWAWRSKAISIGARPETCVRASTIVQVAGKYQATCGRCSRTFHRYKAPRFGRRTHCGTCARVHGMSENTLLVYTIQGVR